MGMKKKEVRRKFNEIVAFSKIEKFIDTPGERDSSGCMSTFAFAVAVSHLEPDILIVDEVLAVGDADFQKKCLSKMREVSQPMEEQYFLLATACRRLITFATGRFGLITVQ